MDSKALSPSVDNVETKAAFKKPSNDTGARRYRRRSPVGGSSSSESSGLKDERSSSPIHSREDYRRDVKEGERDLSRKSGRHYHGRSGETYRYTDQKSSRSSYNDSRRDNYNRRDKVTDKEESYYSKSRSDHAREDNVYKSRRRSRGDDKYSRDRTDGSGHRHRNKDRDERRDYQRVDLESDRSPVYDSGSQRDKAGHRLNEMSKSNLKELDGQKYAKEEKMKSVDQKASKQIDLSDRQPREHLKERSMFTSGNEDSLAKRHKSSSLVNDYEEDVDERKSSKHAPLPAGKVNSEQVLASGCTAADIDAAKRTAMKAAESVNKNLMGTGYMSADQKKKLLWGNKKSTPAEKQSSHPWDTVTFSDREQQEKFNKLMGVKAEVKADQKQESSEVHAEKQKEMQLDLEKQYIAGLRRRDGRTVGLGL